MSVPNEEIIYIYENTILAWFDKKIRKTDMMPLLQAIESGDCEVFAKFLSGQLLDTISFFRYKEDYYHGFLTGILKCFDKYVVRSKREASEGRCELIMEDYEAREKGIIIEIKVASKFSEMEKECDKALAQIETLHYEQELREDGYQEIIKYGISFFKKGCMVKKNKSYFSHLSRLRCIK